MAGPTVSASDPSFVPCLSPVEWTAQRRRGRWARYPEFSISGAPGLASEWVVTQMSQDTDGSGLLSLIWAIWIYWYVYCWLSDPSSKSQDEEGQTTPLNRSIEDASIKLSDDVIVPPQLEALMLRILRCDGTLGIEAFLSERLATYEETIAAFDAGDRKSLLRLVSPEVYEVLSRAMSTRAKQSTVIRTLFSKVDRPEIIDGLIDETHMEVSIRFAGEFYRLSRCARGELTDERLERYRSADIWTFEQDVSQRAAWRVIATESGVQ